MFFWRQENFNSFENVFPSTGKCFKIMEMMLTDEGWEFTQSCSSSPLRNNQSLAFILLCISSFVKYLSFTARFVRPLSIVCWRQHCWNCFAIVYWESLLKHRKGGNSSFAWENFPDFKSLLDMKSSRKEKEKFSLFNLSWVKLETSLNVASLEEVYLLKVLGERG